MVLGMGSLGQQDYLLYDYGGVKDKMDGPVPPQARIVINYGFQIHNEYKSIPCSNQFPISFPQFRHPNLDSTVLSCDYLKEIYSCSRDLMQVHTSIRLF